MDDRPHRIRLRSAATPGPWPPACWRRRRGPRRAAGRARRRGRGDRPSRRFRATGRGRPGPRPTLASGGHAARRRPRVGVPLPGGRPMTRHPGLDAAALPARCCAPQVTRARVASHVRPRCRASDSWWPPSSAPSGRADHRGPAPASSTPSGFPAGARGRAGLRQPPPSATPSTTAPSCTCGCGPVRRSRRIAGGGRRLAHRGPGPWSCPAGPGRRRRHRGRRRPGGRHRRRRHRRRWWPTPACSRPRPAWRSALVWGLPTS